MVFFPKCTFSIFRSPPAIPQTPSSIPHVVDPADCDGLSRIGQRAQTQLSSQKCFKNEAFAFQNLSFEISGGRQTLTRTINSGCLAKRLRPKNTTKQVLLSEARMGRYDKSKGYA